MRAPFNFGSFLGVAFVVLGVLGLADALASGNLLGAAMMLGYFYLAHLLVRAVAVLEALVGEDEARQ